MRLVFGSLAIGLGLAAVVGGCKKPPTYKPEPAYSGDKPKLPAVPKLPDIPLCSPGSPCSIASAQHALNSPRHVGEVDHKLLKLTGYIAKIYLPEEPAGKEGCIFPNLKKHHPDAKHPYPPNVNCDDVRFEPPHFWIADSADQKDPSKMVEVMGYASGWIQQYFAREQYKKDNGGKLKLPDDDTKLYNDNLYTSGIRFIGDPKVGSKVTVTGLFGRNAMEGANGPRISPFGVIDAATNKKGGIECADGGTACEDIPDDK